MTDLRDYPFEPFRGELPAELLAMVTDEPVSRVRLPDGRPAWLVVGYQETCTVLSDERFSRRPDGDESGCPRELNMTGPDHTALRRLAARPFTPRRTEAYRPRVQATCDALVDAMIEAGPPADLMAALVTPFPAIVVCEAVGIPADDRHLLADWCTAMFGLTAPGTDAAAEAAQALRTHIAAYLPRKRETPGDDLLSAWLATQPGTDLTDDEIVSLAFGVLVGGREINSIAVGIRVLLAHPREMDRLRTTPHLVPAAVEEILRHTSVSPLFLTQTALADIDLAGHPIRKGDAVMAIPWAANRHPDVFPDPHHFDIDRTPNPHLTFGYGPHFCLGAALGRLQVEIATTTLLTRLPTLRPAIPLDQLPWRHNRINCGMQTFPITW